MRNPEYHHYVVSSSTGTTVKHTSPKTILKYEFELPSIKEQKFIGQILTNIELKIELNEKINKNLDDLLMSMFKSWFVYFDDVDEFKSDENLGDIPKSWSVEMLEDYVDFVLVLNLEVKIIMKNQKKMIYRLYVLVI